MKKYLKNKIESKARKFLKNKNYDLRKKESKELLKTLVAKTLDLLKTKKSKTSKSDFLDVSKNKIPTGQKIKHSKLISRKIKNNKIKIKDYVKYVMGLDLRTKEAKVAIKELKEMKSPVEIKRFIVKGDEASKVQAQYEKIKLKDINLKKLVDQNVKFFKSGKYQKVAKTYNSDDFSSLGHNLREYINRFTPAEKKLFNQMIGKMSDEKIGERLLKYSVKNNVKDLKFIFYLQEENISINESSKIGRENVAMSNLLDNSFRLDTLKNFIDIFNATSENEQEIIKNYKIYDKLVKLHEEQYE